MLGPIRKDFATSVRVKFYCDCDVAKSLRIGPVKGHLQSCLKDLTLGCMNSLPVARLNQEMAFTQPRAHF